MKFALLLGSIAAISLIPFVSFSHFPWAPVQGTAARPVPPETGVYVWQRHWTPSVVAGVEQTIDAMDSVFVLGAECTVKDNTLRCGTTDADWRLLAERTRSLWIVLRVPQVPAIETVAGQRAAVQVFADSARSILDRIAEPGAPLVGVQLDYDCATEDLGHYAALLAELCAQLPEVPISITALPAWLRHPGMPEVVDGLDHFVLQVHALERPDRLDDPVTLCDVSRIPGWTDDAVRLKTPFYVALPTYGYRLVYDASGNFVGVGAEEREETFAGCTTREIHADPREMAAVVRSFNADPPAHWRGFVWFRMPVEGDRLNWTWPVLADVVNGRAPRTKLKAEVRTPSPDLYEVWVVNEGHYRPTEPAHLTGNWAEGAVIARDAVGGFQFADEALVGPAPYPGEETMAAWFRRASGRGDGIPNVERVALGVAP